MSVFRPGQSARVAYSSLKTAISTMEKAQNCAVLWFAEIMQRGLYRDLVFSSINQYAQQELGWSRTRTSDFIQLAQKLEKRGGVPAVQVEALLSVMAGFLENESEMPPRGGIAPVQIHVHQCPDCEKATVQTNHGELELTQAEAERAQCDAHISQPGQRNTTTIPPKARRQVLARDRHRCRRNGCEHTRFPEVHHIVPRSSGGGNDTDNLITLCSACHRLLHSRKLDEEFLRGPFDRNSEE